MINPENTILYQSGSNPVGGIVPFDTFAELPSPVGRYLRHTFWDGTKMIRTATFHQTGMIRTSAHRRNWSSFTANHLAMPPTTGFVWNARVKTPLTTHVSVLDSYISGIATGHVRFMSCIPIASATDRPELNSGALHRYLAEAVWYPTALLPQSGVVWTPIDDLRAMATLSNCGTSVSLEFRFNDIGEVTGIFTPARFGRFAGQYRQMPWEGHFRNYQVRAGMRVPLYGEVGWYTDEKLELVWKGNITRTEYGFIR